MMAHPPNEALDIRRRLTAFTVVGLVMLVVFASLALVASWRLTTTPPERQTVVMTVLLIAGLCGMITSAGVIATVRVGRAALVGGEIRPMPLARAIKLGRAWPWVSASLGLLVAAASLLSPHISRPSEEFPTLAGIVLSLLVLVAGLTVDSPTRMLRSLQ
ncbi:hypothetical protein AB0M43_37505 [Longispora sp. NPDC051575]|uniref:hypothetical protein n=1 Tax=Longispora sp. NPDC051575 TaxID=3154943 RepID=UPI00341B64BD